VLLRISAHVSFAIFASVGLDAITLFPVDGPISNTFLWLNEINAGMVIKAIAVVYLTPVFIFPCIIIAVVGARLGQVYMKAQIAIKREMSNAKAPVLGHFGAAVAGLGLLHFLTSCRGG
jgi:hypothetical protein